MNIKSLSENSSGEPGVCVQQCLLFAFLKILTAVRLYPRVLLIFVSDGGISRAHIELATLFFLTSCLCHAIIGSLPLASSSLLQLRGRGRCQLFSRRHPFGSSLRKIMSAASDQTRMGEGVSAGPALPGQLFAPSAARNGPHISAVLGERLPAAASPLRVLEVASGTGQHVALLAKTFPHWFFSPSDILDDHLVSIRAHVAVEQLTNVDEPLVLDAAAPDTWPVVDDSIDLILNVNMIHISPFATCQGLVAAAGRLLHQHGHLVLYGPFAMHGVISPDSNVAFDASLRQRDPAWGLRDVDDVTTLATAAGLNLVHEVPMPANNCMLFYRKS